MIEINLKNIFIHKSNRLIDEEASKVHGIMNEDLIDKPLFEDIAEEFLEFIDGSL